METIADLNRKINELKKQEAEKKKKQDADHKAFCSKITNTKDVDWLRSILLEKEFHNIGYKYDDKLILFCHNPNITDDIIDIILSRCGYLHSSARKVLMNNPSVSEEKICEIFDKLDYDRPQFIDIFDIKHLGKKSKKRLINKYCDKLL